MPTPEQTVSILIQVVALVVALGAIAHTLVPLFGDDEESTPHVSSVPAVTPLNSPT